MGNLLKRVVWDKNGNRTEVSISPQELEKIVKSSKPAQAAPVAPAPTPAPVAPAPPKSGVAGFLSSLMGKPAGGQPVSATPAVRIGGNPNSNFLPGSKPATPTVSPLQEALAEKTNLAKELGKYVTKPAPTATQGYNLPTNNLDAKPVRMAQVYDPKGVPSPTGLVKDAQAKALKSLQDNGATVNIKPYLPASTNAPPAPQAARQANDLPQKVRPYGGDEGPLNAAKFAPHSEVPLTQSKHFNLDLQDRMAPEEVGQYESIWRSQGWEAAQRFYNNLYPTLQARRADGQGFMARNVERGLTQFADGMAGVGDYVKDLAEGQNRPDTLANEAYDAQREGARSYQGQVGAINERAGAAAKVGGDVVTGIAQMVPAMLTGAGMGVRAASSMLGASAGGHYMDKAEQDGANMGARLAYGVIGGVAEAKLQEILYLNKVLKFGNDDIAKAFTNSMKGNLKLIGKNYAKASAGEGVEEALINPVMAATGKLLYGSKDPIFDLKQMAYDGLIGVLVGFGASVHTIPAAVRNEQASRQAINESLAAAEVLPYNYAARATAEAIQEGRRSLTKGELEAFNQMVQSGLQQYRHEVATGVIDPGDKGVPLAVTAAQEYIDAAVETSMALAAATSTLPLDAKQQKAFFTEQLGVMENIVQELESGEDWLDTKAVAAKLQTAETIVKNVVLSRGKLDKGSMDVAEQYLKSVRKAQSLLRNQLSKTESQAVAQRINRFYEQAGIEVPQENPVQVSEDGRPYAVAEHTHTRTGEKIYVVRPNGKIENFRKLQSVMAKEFGASHSKATRGFNFYHQPDLAALDRVFEEHGVSTKADLKPENVETAAAEVGKVVAMPKAEEPKAEEPQTEEPKAEEPKVHQEKELSIDGMTYEEMLQLITEDADIDDRINENSRSPANIFEKIQGMLEAIEMAKRRGKPEEFIEQFRDQIKILEKQIENLTARYNSIHPTAELIRNDPSFKEENARRLKEEIARRENAGKTEESKVHQEKELAAAASQGETRPPEWMKNPVNTTQYGWVDVIRSDDSIVELKHSKGAVLQVGRKAFDQMTIGKEPAQEKSLDQRIEEMNQKTEADPEDLLPEEETEDTDGDRQSLKDRLVNDPNLVLSYDEIMSIPEIVEVEEYIKGGVRTIDDTSAERERLREEVALKGYGEGAQRKEWRVDICVGLPAAGKSSVLAEPLAKRYGSLIIDSDWVKEQMPEYAGGLGAHGVHDESTLIAEAIRDMAIKNGDNIVLPVVGKSEETMRDLIKRLCEIGYSVHLHLNEVPPEVAMSRAARRFFEEGRYVNIPYIHAVGSKPSEVYDRIKLEEGVVSYEKFSNNVPKGEPAISLERGGQAEVEGEDGGGQANPQEVRGSDQDGGRGAGFPGKTQPGALRPGEDNPGADESRTEQVTPEDQPTDAGLSVSKNLAGPAEVWRRLTSDEVVEIGSFSLHTKQDEDGGLYYLVLTYDGQSFDADRSMDNTELLEYIESLANSENPEGIIKETFSVDVPAFTREDFPEAVAIAKKTEKPLAKEFFSGDPLTMSLEEFLKANEDKVEELKAGWPFYFNYIKDGGGVEKGRAEFLKFILTRAKLKGRKDSLKFSGNAIINGKKFTKEEWKKGNTGHLTDDQIIELQRIIKAFGLESKILAPEIVTKKTRQQPFGKRLVVMGNPVEFAYHWARRDMIPATPQERLKAEVAKSKSKPETGLKQETPALPGDSHAAAVSGEPLVGDPFKMSLEEYLEANQNYSVPVTAWHNYWTVAQGVSVTSESKSAMDEAKRNKEEFLKLAHQYGLNDDKVQLYIGNGVYPASGRTGQKFNYSDIEPLRRFFEAFGFDVELDDGMIDLKVPIATFAYNWAHRAEIIKKLAGTETVQKKEETVLKKDPREDDYSIPSTTLEKTISPRTTFTVWYRIFNEGVLVRLDDLKTFVGDVLDNMDAWKERLSKDSTIDDLKQMQRMAHAYPPENKAAWVKRTIEDTLDFIVIQLNQSSTIVTHMDGKSWAQRTRGRFDKLFEGMTQEQLNRIQDAKAAWRQGQIERLKNPQTFDDYQFAKARRKLTPDETRRYEDLLAEKNKVQDQKAEERKATKAITAAGDQFTDLEEGKNTKTGETLFNFKLKERVDGDTFKAILAQVKKLGGSFWKGNFYFTTDSREEAQAKLDTLKTGGTVTKAPEAAQAEAEQKVSKAAEKLRSLADGMQKTIDDKFKSRLTNTAKRASEAASQEAQGEALKRTQAMLRKIADALEKGEFKFLDKITNRAQVEQLVSILRAGGYHWALGESKTTGKRLEEIDRSKLTVEAIDYAKMPTVWVEHLVSVAQKLATTPGYKRVATAFVEKYKGQQKAVPVSDVIHFMEAVKDTKEFKDSRGAEALTDFRRLTFMGISNEVTLRAALRELLPIFNGDSMTESDLQAKKEREMKRRESEIARTKIEGYFPTPAAVVDRMLELVQLEEGDRVLEPSAGAGHIADAVLKEGVNVTLDVCEWNSSLRQLLTDKGHNVIGEDALEIKGEYDVIVMNPPFEKLQDVDHVRYAYENNLAPGGRLVAIMSESPFFNSTKKAEDFRQWLEEQNGWSEKLPEGAFKESDRSTGVATRIVMIEKPRAAEKPVEEPKATVAEPSSAEKFNKGFESSYPTSVDPDLKMINDPDYYAGHEYGKKMRRIRTQFIQEADATIAEYIGKRPFSSFGDVFKAYLREGDAASSKIHYLGHIDKGGDKRKFWTQGKEIAQSTGDLVAFVKDERATVTHVYAVQLPFNGAFSSDVVPTDSAVRAAMMEYASDFVGPKDLSNARHPQVLMGQYEGHQGSLKWERLQSERQAKAEADKIEAEKASESSARVSPEMSEAREKFLRRWEDKGKSFYLFANAVFGGNDVAAEIMVDGLEVSLLDAFDILQDGEKTGAFSTDHIDLFRKKLDIEGLDRQGVYEKMYSLPPNVKVYKRGSITGKELFSEIVKTRGIMKGEYDASGKTEFWYTNAYILIAESEMTKSMKEFVEGKEQKDLKVDQIVGPLLREKGSRSVALEPTYVSEGSVFLVSQETREFVAVVNEKYLNAFPKDSVLVSVDPATLSKPLLVYDNAKQERCIGVLLPIRIGEDAMMHKRLAHLYDERQFEKQNRLMEEKEAVQKEAKKHEALTEIPKTGFKKAAFSILTNQGKQEVQGLVYGDYGIRKKAVTHLPTGVKVADTYSEGDAKAIARLLSDYIPAGIDSVDAFRDFLANNKEANRAFQTAMSIKHGGEDFIKKEVERQLKYNRERKEAIPSWSLTKDMRDEDIFYMEYLAKLNNDRLEKKPTSSKFVAVEEAVAEDEQLGIDDPIQPDFFDAYNAATIITNNPHTKASQASHDGPILSATQIAKMIENLFKVPVTKVGFKAYRRGVKGYYRGFPKDIVMKHWTIAPYIHELGHFLDDHYKWSKSGNPNILAAVEAMAQRLPVAFAQGYVPDFGKVQFSALTPQQQLVLRKEAVAEFLRLSMVDPAEAAVFGKEFGPLFKASLSAEHTTDLERVTGEVQKFFGASTGAQIGSAIYKYGEEHKAYEFKGTVRERLAQNFTEIANRLYDFFVDDLKAVSDADDYMDQMLRQAGVKANFNKHDRMTYKLALLSRFSNRAAQELITKQFFDADRNTIKIERNKHEVVNGKTVVTKVSEAVSFAEIINRVPKESYEAFNRYLAIRVAIDRHAHGKRVFSEDHSIKDLRREAATILKEHPTVYAASRELYRWWDAFVEGWLLKGGLLDADLYRHLRKMYPHYVPTFRVKEEVHVIGGRAVVKAKKSFEGHTDVLRRTSKYGDDDPIFMPVESMMMEVERYVTAVQRHRVMLSLHAKYQQLLKHYKNVDKSVGLFIRQIPPEQKATTDHPIDWKMSFLFTYYREQIEKQAQATGVKPEVIELAMDDLARSAGTAALLKFIQAQGWPVTQELVEGMLSTADHVTRFSPQKNSRGETTVDVLAPNGVMYHYEVKDPRLLKALMGGDARQIDRVTEFLVSIRRGIQLSITSLDPTFILRNAARDSASTFAYGSVGLHKLPLELAKAFLDVAKDSEEAKAYRRMGGGMASAISADRNAMDEMRMKVNPHYMTEHPVIMGAKKGAEVLENFNDAVESMPRLSEFNSRVGTDSDFFDLVDAFYNSQDVTLNFLRRGQIMNYWYGQLMIFGNPAIQGFDKLLRAHKDLKTAGRTASRALLTIGLFQLLLLALHGDDEEYKALSDTVKDNYWVLFKVGPGKWVKVPKPRELGMIYGSAFERAWRQLAQDDPAAWHGFREAVLKNVFPNISWVGSVAWQAASNTQWNGSPIVTGQAAYTRDGHAQYDENTSYVARGIAQLFPSDSVMGSPMKADYMIKQSTGIFGKVLLPLLAPGGLTSTAGVSSVGASMARPFIADLAYSNQSISKFYDLSEKLEQAEAEFKNSNVKGEFYNKSLAKRFREAADNLAETRKVIRSMENWTQLKNSERLAVLREMRKAAIFYQTFSGDQTVLKKLEAAGLTVNFSKPLPHGLKEDIAKAARYIMMLEAKEALEKAPKEWGY